MTWRHSTFRDRWIRKACEFVSKHLPGRLIFRDGEDVYLERYWLFKRAWLHLPEWVPNVYLHHFRRSDQDRELHNHPWGKSASLILVGGYIEERRHGDAVLSELILPGDINRIDADTFHRVDLVDHDAWTIFCTGERQQSWGFWDRKTGEYVDWKEHVRRTRRQ